MSTDKRKDNRSRKGTTQRERVLWLAAQHDLLDGYPRPVGLIRKWPGKVSWLDDVIFRELKKLGLYGAGTHQGDCNIVELVRLARLERTASHPCVSVSIRG